MKSGAVAKRDGSPMASASDHIQAAERTQVLHQRKQRPARDLRAQIVLNAVSPLFAQTYRLDAFLQHDLLCGLSKTLIGKPSAVRLCPGRLVAGVDPLMT